MFYLKRCHRLTILLLILLLTGKALADGHGGGEEEEEEEEDSGETELPGYLEDACAYRTWEDPEGEEGNCALFCGANQYYTTDENGGKCEECEEGQLTVYGSNAWNPVGQEACQKEVLCSEPFCHQCQFIALPMKPSGKAMRQATRCICRTGFSVERESVEGEEMDFLICKRDCENRNGGCMHECDDGECTCREGFDPEYEGEVCKDVDECTKGDHTCRYPHRCENTPGSYKCNCAPGYISTLDGKRCTRAEDLVCTLSMMKITAEDFLPDDYSPGDSLESEEFDEYEPDKIKALFKEAASYSGNWLLDAQVEPNFGNGVLEVQVILRFAPSLQVEKEVMLMKALSKRLTVKGYGVTMGGKMRIISQPILCYSQNTLGAPLPIDAPCEWYNAYGYCLQSSECEMDTMGKPYCSCPDGWYGERCQLGEATIADIVLIVIVAIIIVLMIVMACFLCKPKPRVPIKVRPANVAMPAPVQQPFPGLIKFQPGPAYGDVTYISN